MYFNFSNDPIKVIKDSVTNKTVKVHEKIAGDVRFFFFLKIFVKLNQRLF